ncbi:unnamed protein product, partial [Meganyctiphanes norvegica]
NPRNAAKISGTLLSLCQESLQVSMSIPSIAPTGESVNLNTAEVRCKMALVVGGLWWCHWWRLSWGGDGDKGGKGDGDGTLGSGDIGWTCCWWQCQFEGEYGDNGDGCGDGSSGDDAVSNGLVSNGDVCITF